MSGLRVVLAGGGSGGSAAPAIAVGEAIARRWPSAELLYIGTASGPEAALARAAGLPYVAIRAGRWRRYLTWKNATDPALVAMGLAQALAILRKFQPGAAFGSGGFATVAPLLAARIRRVPVLVHQQDVIPGLANRILAPFATRVTVAHPKSREMFWRYEPRVVGNPVRSAVLAGDATRARHRFCLDANRPVVLVTGGGTGAARLNWAAVEAARHLVGDCQLVHLTGGREPAGIWSHPDYHRYEFLSEEMGDALAVADVVVSRAGMSALAEMAALRKAAILVPMPNSHQEANAAVFVREGAAILLREEQLTPEALAEEVRALMRDPERRQALGAAAARVLPSGAADAICQEIAAVLRTED